jgi:hypothetical protein
MFWSVRFQRTGYLIFVLSCIATFSALSVSLANCGEVKRKGPSAGNAVNSYPTWTDSEIATCLQSTQIEDKECWPDHFEWQKVLSVGSATTDLDITSDIVAVIDHMCKFPGAPLPYETQSSLVKKARFMNWAIHDMDGLVAYAKKNGYCSDPARRTQILQLIDEIESYTSLYRNVTLRDFVTNPASRQKFDPDAYASKGGIGFLTIKGRNPASGSLCYVKDSDFVAAALDESLLPREAVPTPLVKLHLFSKQKLGLSWGEGFVRTFVGLPESKDSGVFYRNKCGVLAAKTTLIVKYKKAIEDSMGYSTIVFDEIIPEGAYNAALGPAKQLEEKEAIRAAQSKAENDALSSQIKSQSYVVKTDQAASNQAAQTDKDYQATRTASRVDIIEEDVESKEEKHRSGRFDNVDEIKAAIQNKLQYLKANNSPTSNCDAMVALTRKHERELYYSLSENMAAPHLYQSWRATANICNVF